MRLVIAVVFLLGCSGSAFADKNFWNNDICTTDRDCSGLTSCHPTFGCTLSGAKVGLVMLVVFVTLCAFIVAVAWLCRRNFRGNRFGRPHNQYLPQTVITTNVPAWNQHQQQMGVYPPQNPPHNPYPNQFYANSVNPPAYNPYMDTGINANQVPSAPYAPAAYGHEPQTYHSKH